jgi:hypothetical protein
MQAPRVIQCGTVAIATRQSGVCDPGERGICYEVYELGGRPEYSFIFEKGRYDGFSPEEVAMLLKVTPTVCHTVTDYQFRNVTRLLRDFAHGRFTEAFPSRQRQTEGARNDDSRS